MYYYALGLIYTRKCVAKCDICGLSCSSEKDEKMELEDAKNYIKQSKECFKSGRPIVAITGGEPFIYLDDICDLISYSASLNARRISITSNCFWAKTYDITYEIMKRLYECGLDHLRISCDEFHNQVVPYENVKNVLKVGKVINIKITLSCTVMKNGKNLGDVVNGLGSVSFDYDMCQHAAHPIGRAAEVFSEEDFYYEHLTDECPEKGILAIDTNGNVYPCGSFWAMNDKRLLGNAKKTPLKELIAKADTLKHEVFISENGVLPYINKLRENNDKFKNKQFVNPCNACGYLYDNCDKSIMDSILNEISEK